MPQDSSKDLIYLREWMKKEPHLTAEFDDQTLKKFLHSCYDSLESTKKCIDRFSTARVEISQVFCKRDPLLPNIQTALSMVNFAIFKFGSTEYFYYKVIDNDFEKFNYLDFCKAFTVIADYWVCSDAFLADAHIFILDMELITLKLVPKLNISVIRDLILFLLEGMPIRVKHILAINAPSYYEMLYALVKPILPQEICNIIKFFPNTKGVEKIIDYKYLPKDLGGEYQSVKDTSDALFKKIIEEKREMFLDDNLWKADIEKKPKGRYDKPLLMHGSFRTLSID